MGSSFCSLDGIKSLSSDSLSFNVRRYHNVIAIHERYAKALNDGDLNELRQIILDEEIVCPISGTKNWTEVRQFNLMFNTEMGSTADGAMKIYLRPETAQGIFVNYLNVQKTGRMKLPFGIAQIGKAFRNEIVARQFIFRMREFEQMEMQFFVKPGTELEWFKTWKEIRLKWHKALGFGDDHYRYHDHELFPPSLGIIFCILYRITERYITTGN